MKIETTLGALIASLTLFLTGILALFQQNSELALSDISQSAWIVLGVGGLVSFLKDYQALRTRKAISKVTGGTP